MDQRLRAACDLLVPQVRAQAGRHEYDGRVPDLSPEGVRDGLAALGGATLADPHDDAHLAAIEERLRVTYGELELHRRNPQMLLGALDVAGYDRPYAPEEERAAARRAHLARWPEAIDAGLASLDAVPAPVATALLGSARGLAAGLPADEDAARAAHVRLVSHLEDAAEHGPADAAIGEAALARLLGAGEGLEVDLATLAAHADAERERLRAMLDDACGRIDAERPTAEVVAELRADHPDAAGVLTLARDLTAEAIAFTRDDGLLAPEHLDGDCEVAPSPPARRWATALMSWAAPGEPDGPSFYFITPPDTTWSADRQRQWLQAFSRTTLPATTVHEVAPGHYAHGRALRRADGDVRRTLFSSAFIEGWAHYAEELCVERGFRSADPRFAAGVAIQALLRVVRLSVAIELHAGELTVAEAAARFEAEAFSPEPAAEAEARRATFDPTYGRYTWGKLVITQVRDEARRQWGSGFSLRRFHDALLALGAPPLGLVEHALAAR